jgi:hypothetical protein
LTGIFAHRFIFAIIFRFAHLSFAESFFILQWAGVALPMFDSLISQCILRWAGVALLIFHFAIGWNLRPSFYPRNHFSRGWCSNQPLSAAKTAVAHEQVPLPPLTNGLPRLLFVSPSQSPFAFLPSSLIPPCLRVTLYLSDSAQPVSPSVPRSSYQSSCVRPLPTSSPADRW